MDEIRKHIGERIRAAREEGNVTQKELGDFLGYSAMAVSHFENGIRQLRFPELKKLADFFHKPLDFFLATTLFRIDGDGDNEEVSKSMDAFDKFISGQNGNK